MITVEDFSKAYTNLEMLARGGQKIVFSAYNERYGSVVVKLFFRLDDPRSTREIEIGQQYPINAVPKIFETGLLLYEKTETLYIVEQKIDGRELRKVISTGHLFPWR